MLYYVEYNPQENMNHVRAYDEQKHGVPRHAAHGYFLYHGATHVSNIYQTERDALKSFGAYSRKLTEMPDGSTVIPVDIFHPEETVKNVFIPWNMIRGEKWLSERL